jgi:hypothetical protein
MNNGVHTFRVTLSCQKSVNFFYPGHKPNVEIVFSLISASRTKIRNGLSIDFERIILAKYNFKNVTCLEFHTCVAQNNELLQKVALSGKYANTSMHVSV